MGMSCTCFGPKHSPYSNYWCCTLDILAVGTIFNIFNYNVVSSRDSNLSPPRRRASALHVEPRSQVTFVLSLNIPEKMWPAPQGSFHWGTQLLFQPHLARKKQGWLLGLDRNIFRLDTAYRISGWFIMPDMLYTDSFNIRYPSEY